MSVTDWLIGISALATTALAIAAFMAIRQNRRIREEDRERELKRNPIDEILNWAEKATDFFKEDMSLQSGHSLVSAIGRFTELETRKRIIVQDRCLLFGDNLKNVLKSVDDAMSVFNERLKKLAFEFGDPDRSKMISAVLNAKGDVGRSLSNMILRVEELRTKLGL